MNRIQTTLVRIPSSIDVADRRKEIWAMSPADVQVLYSNCIRAGVDMLIEAGLCLEFLGQHGYEVKDMPMAGSLLRIASGQVPAELVHEFLQSPSLSLVELLPRNEQLKLVSNPMVTAVIRKPDGSVDKVLIDTRTAPRSVVALVIGRNGIRDTEEQLAQMNTKKVRPPTKSVEDDVEANGEAYSRTFTLKLTESQYYAINALAGEAKKSPAVFARQALLRSGAFKTGKR